MNIFLQELKAYRKSTLTWTFTLAGFVVLFLSLFPSVSREAENFQHLMEGFPEGVRLALGLSVENIGFILGFYSYILLYISLLGAIQAMILGTSIVSAEVREKTADFLLTKPVTRTRIMTAKILAAFTSLIITNCFYLSAATAMASLVEPEEYSMKIFLLLSLTLIFLQLIFLALGVMISAMLPRIRTVLPISLGTVFGFFIIGALASTTGDQTLRYLTPFKYFDFTYIIQNASYEHSFFLVALGCIVLAIIAGYFIYTKRDIRIV